MKTSQLLKLRTVFPSISAVLLVMVFLTPTARATTTPFEIVSAGSSGNLGGVDTSPYNASINGGPTIPAICDDFVDEIVPPESWAANVTLVSSLAGGTSSVVKWGDSGSIAAVGPFSITVPPTYNIPGWASLTQAQAYAVAADLAIQILQASQGSSVQKDLSFAEWELFNPAAVIGDGSLAPQDLYNATEDLINAISTAGPASQYSNVEIYTYAGGGVSCPGNTCAPPPQEFIVVTPEPTSTLLFGTGLLGIIFVLRKRLFA